MGRARWAVLFADQADIFSSIPSVHRFVEWSGARLVPQTAGVGYLDILVRLLTPGRVFSWWDAAISAAAATLGGLACARWRRVGRTRP